MILDALLEMIFSTIEHRRLWRSCFAWELERSEAWRWDEHLCGYLRGKVNILFVLIMLSTVRLLEAFRRLS